jgi:hypothetical protein
MLVCWGKSIIGGLVIVLIHNTAVYSKLDSTYSIQSTYVQYDIYSSLLAITVIEKAPDNCYFNWYVIGSFVIYVNLKSKI